MPAKREASRETKPDDSRSATRKRRGGRASLAERSAVIERRIARLRQELDDLKVTRPWGPALGFTAAWLGLIIVFVGLVTRTNLIWLAGILAMLAGVPAFLVTAARRRQEGRLRAEIEENERRLDAPAASPAERLLEAHLDSLDRHFRLVSEHADRGFLVAVGTGAVGVLLIVLGLVLGFRGGEAGRGVAWMAAVGGLGMQLIAGLLFLLYVRSLGHLQAFQDRLARSQQTLVAFTEAATLSDAEDRDRVIAGLIATVVADGPKGQDEDTIDVLGLLRRASS
jgi:hypothetical protein